MMLTIVAAAALALPSATSEFDREVERDIPPRVLRTETAGIWYQTFVDTNGRITECTVRGTLGESNEAELACEAIKGRRIKPASVDGKASYGVYQGTVVLSDNTFDPSDIVFDPDVILEVENLPSNRPLTTQLVVLVDTAGKVSECRSKDGRNPAYAEVACEQAKGIDMPVGKSASGEAVPYVYPLTYQFTTNLASN